MLLEKEKPQQLHSPNRFKNHERKKQTTENQAKKKLLFVTNSMRQSYIPFNLHTT